MISSSHVVFGAAFYALCGAVAGTPVSPIGAGVAAAAALLPDADTPHSTLGRRLPALSWPIYLSVGHRTATHSLLALLALYFALDGVALAIGAVLGVWVAEAAWTHALLPIVLGYASHLLGDALTPSGIRPFWPVTARVAVPLFQSGTTNAVGQVIPSFAERAFVWMVAPLSFLGWLSS